MDTIAYKPIRSTSLPYDEKYDKRLSMIISAVIFLIFMTNLTHGFQAIINVEADVIIVIYKAMIGIMLFSCTLIFFRRMNPKMIYFALFSALVIGLNYLLFPQTIPYFKSNVITYITMCFPPAFCILALQDVRILMDTLRKMSCIVGIIVFMQLTMCLVWNVPFFEKYSMGYSYSCLLPSLILLHDFIYNKKKISLLLFFTIVLTIVLYGARGPILCIGVYIILGLCKKYVSNKKQAYKVVVILIVAIILLSARELIFEQIGLFLERHEIYSRTINSLMSSEIGLSGRDRGYERILAGFIDNPLVIRGINADYLVVGGYSHNIFLELLYDFGLILGGFAIILILVMVVKALTIKSNSCYADLLLLLMSICLAQLSVSSSLWINHTFWMWTALTVKSHREPIAKHEPDIKTFNLNMEQEV